MSQVRPEAKKTKPMWVALWPLAFLVLAFANGSGQSPLTKAMGITQKLGDMVPTQTQFTDETGKVVTLGEEISSRPTVLVPIYYKNKTGCAVLTDNIMKTLAKATKGDILMPGRDLNVLMYSIDPVEKSDLALERKKLILSQLTPSGLNPDQAAQWRIKAEQGLHCLTGSMESIQALSNAIGLKYLYKTVPDLEAGKTINLIDNPTCTVMVTPSGLISSYTIGNEFQTKEIEAAVALAGKGKIGKPADQSSMFGCIMVDPVTGRNRVAIETVWRVISVLCLIGLGATIVSLFVKNNRENISSGGGLSTR